MSKRWPSPKSWKQASMEIDGELVEMEFEQPVSVYDALLALAEKKRAKPSGRE
jgi:hypothetical protein